MEKNGEKRGDKGKRGEMAVKRGGKQGEEARIRAINFRKGEKREGAQKKEEKGRGKGRKGSKVRSERKKKSEIKDRKQGEEETRTFCIMIHN